MVNRRSTPQYASRSSGGGRASREKEREEEDRGLVGESFPQFCTYCEKQINSSSSNFLYCSETCRKRDLPSSGHSHQTSLSNSPTSPSFPPTPYSSYVRPLSTIYTTATDRDIIPRASPTTLRPRSYYAGDPFPGSKAVPISPSRPSTNSSSNSSALASLRELSAALENTRTDVRDRHGASSAFVASRRPIARRSDAGCSGSDADGEDGEGESAQTSGTTSPVSRSASAVWSYMTFAGSVGNTAGAGAGAMAPPPPAPPRHIARSYTAPQPTAATAAAGSYAYGTYAGPGAAKAAGGYGYGYGYGYGNTPSSSSRDRDANKYRYAPSSAATYTTAPPLSTAASGMVGMERPLPPRSGGYSHRPRSMDLVTPYSSGYGG